MESFTKLSTLPKVYFSLRSNNSYLTVREKTLKM